MTTALYVPPCDLLTAWLDRQASGPDGKLLVPYDDLLDVLKPFLRAVPLDETWYLSQYPGVASHVSRTQGETARSHFVMHGYFEGRLPFADGWNGHQLPVPFAQLKLLLHLAPKRGRLIAMLSRDEIIGLIKLLLRSIPVDASWYRSAYPTGDSSGPTSEHYAETGYFAGFLPADIEVDADWYLARYPHVRTGLERGLAASAKDHFLKLGYREGCRPVPMS